MQARLAQHLRTLLRSAESIELGDKIRDQPINAGFGAMGEVGSNQPLEVRRSVPMRRGWVVGHPLMPSRVCGFPDRFLAKPIEPERGVRIEQRESFDEPLNLRTTAESHKSVKGPPNLIRAL